MDLPDEVKFRASIMPTRIFQDGSIRVVFTSNLDEAMVAVQAVLSLWLARGTTVEVSVRPIERPTETTGNQKPKF